MTASLHRALFLVLALLAPMFAMPLHHAVDHAHVEHAAQEPFGWHGDGHCSHTHDADCQLCQGYLSTTGLAFQSDCADAPATARSSWAPPASFAPAQAYSPSSPRAPPVVS